MELECIQSAEATLIIYLSADLQLNDPVKFLFIYQQSV